LESLSSSTARTALFIDIDGFLFVNGVLGHHEGDRILKVIARKVFGTVMPPALAARIGGDEFIVLAPPERAAEIADQLHHAMRQLFSTERRDVKLKADPSVIIEPPDRGVLTLSIGVAPLAKFGASPGERIAAAEAACQQAKRRGRDCTHTVQGDESETDA
jgi:diguanylate cyclase (GGDEF)-like protein